jgi:hypothetical protein
LEAASAATGTSVSTFVLAAATEAAADVLADRRVFVLDQQAWRVFDEALTRPAGDVAGCGSCWPVRPFSSPRRPVRVSECVLWQGRAAVGRARRGRVRLRLVVRGLDQPDARVVDYALAAGSVALHHPPRRDG